MNYLQTVNPATEEIISRFEVVSDKDVLHSLRSLKHNQLQWKDIPLSTRLEHLNRVCQDLQEHAYQYAALISLETGLPLQKSLKEIDATIHICRWYQDKIFASTNPREFQRPQGIFLLIMPRVHTFYLPFRAIIPALISGNTVALKHSSHVPQLSQTIEGIFQKTFLRGLVESFLINRSQIERIIRYPNVKKIYFFGKKSSRKKIISLATRHHTPIFAPPTGRNTQVILDESHLSQALQSLLDSTIKMSGQSCTATSHIFVKESVLPSFLRLVETELSALNIGDPLDENTQVGPIMTSQDCTGIENLLQNAKVNHSNMKVVLGGNRMNRKGWFFHPTIILTEESNQSEVFGPVIFIHPFKTLEHLTLTYGKIQFSTHTQWQEQSSSSQKPIISSQRILINQSISDFPYFPDSTVDELV